MRVVMFYHSLLSDWNHGNAHFLRGVVTELMERGHTVSVYEPADSWSYQNMLADKGERALTGFRAAYPGLKSTRYNLDDLDLAEALDGADLVMVHEWNDHELVRRVGEQRSRDGHYVLLFHDTHHRSVTDPEAMAAYDLSNYDGVLAFGEVVRNIYLQKGWAEHAWTWHEAADTRVFRPVINHGIAGDLVWIGNWGDGERTAELHEFLLNPSSELGLKTRVYGVRYPQEAKEALASAGIDYGGWLPNYEVPYVFSQYRVTVHVPRRPYAEALPGIPTIRPFEALACGIPLVTAPWDDAEGLFRPGEDFLVAQNGEEMARHLRAVLNDSALASALVYNGLSTILDRHTCVHRVDQLMEIYGSIAAQPPALGARMSAALL